MTDAIDFIASFEGFSSKPYLCPAGKWTIGFGDTMWKGKPVTSLTKQIDREDADNALAHRLVGFQAELDSLVNVPLNRNENLALLSLIYNIGATKLKKSTLLRLLNNGKRQEAAEEFLKWDKSGGKRRRREAERKLFLTTVKG